MHASVLAEVLPICSQIVIPGEDATDEVGDHKPVREVHLTDYEPPPYLVKHIALQLRLSYEETEVISDLYMCCPPGATTPHDCILDGEDLELLSVSLLVEKGGSVEIQDGVDPQRAGRPLDASKHEYKVLRNGRLWVNAGLFPSEPNVVFKIRTHVKIYPDKNLQLSGLYKAGALLCTQCEAEGFRRITYALCRPDVLSTYEVRLEADFRQFPILLSNGNRVQRGDVPGSAHLHYVVYKDPFPKPCYLFAVIAGDLVCKEDTHVKKNGEEVELKFWCKEGDQSKLDWAIHALKCAMEWDANTFGLEYDLHCYNVVAVDNFNAGAMENKSLNIFNSALLLTDPNVSTDDDFLRIMRSVGHEYFHNWTGNRVTCRDWFQLTLKEGLTVFREQWFHATMWSPDVARIQDVQRLRATQFLEDASPLRHPIRPEKYVSVDNFYTATVYDKGAEVVRLCRTILGDQGFKEGLALYIARHDGQAVTCDDFVDAMGSASGRDLGLMTRWYSQAGTPVVRVSDVFYVKEKQEFSFSIEQITEEKKPLLIPIRFALIGRDSKQEVLPEIMIEMKVKGAVKHLFSDVQEDCVLSVLRGFSAPVRLILETADEDLGFLMRYDSDLFSRWEAGQVLITRAIRSYYLKIAAGEEGEPEAPTPTVPFPPFELPLPFKEAFAWILAAPMEDMAAKALLLSLPDVTTLLAGMDGPCHPGLLQEARRAVQLALSTTFHEAFLKLYHVTESARAYEVTAPEVGRRQLRNLCLWYLTAKDPCAAEPRGYRLALNHFHTANNMTDRLAAVQCLKDMVGPERDEVLKRQFYNETDGDELTFVKWISLNALADVPSVIEDLKSLRSRKPFDITNANHVRVLYCSFASNWAQFHRDDGQGYRFLADAVIEVDQFNNQSAARLLREFSSKTYTEKLQKLILSEVNRILQTPYLSKDCYEICTQLLRGD